MLCPRCHRVYAPGETHCKYDGAELTSGRRIDHVRVQGTRQMGAILGGRWAVKGFIGRGGTARVYLAEDVKTGDAVAVKMLDPPWAHDKVARERFMREAEAARSVQHPGVVEILTVGARGDGSPYLVMEYLFGETLAAALERTPRLELDIALPVLREVARAIQAAHAAGVLHRDVKPDNIFLLGEPGDPYGVKLVDFGFARLRDSTITASGTAIGTAQFMAPEQCVADEADARTDVYGFGVVAYRVLSGAMPFDDGAETQDWLGWNLIAPHVPASSRVPTIDSDLEAFLDKCLRKDPANRYASMTEVIDDLEALAHGRSPRAVHDEPAASDVYQPKTPFSKLVAKALYRRIGVPAPSHLG
jgi:serine/threonine-protein kinase